MKQTPLTAEDLKDRIQRVKERISEAAWRVGRSPQEVELIAVTKSVDPQLISQAAAAGIKIAGENRVQELIAKQPQVEPALRWHFIGTLQRNKVRQLLGRVELIHLLDSLRLAEEIAARSRQQHLVTPVLLQVNLSGETSKRGMTKDLVFPLLERLGRLEGITILGLMTIAPRARPAETRAVFRGLRDLSEQIKREGFPGVSMQHLSMGMTDDFEVAVEEGATLVRVGRAIFGPR